MSSSERSVQAERSPAGVDHLVPIQDNAYCAIQGGLLDGEAVVVKRYRDEGSTLARREADAIAWLAGRLEGEPGFMAAGLRSFDPESGTLVMDRLPGRSLASLVQRAAGDPVRRARLVRAVERLGALLARIRDETAQPGAEPSPFLLEYLAWVSAGLESLPAVGPAMFRGSSLSAVHLWQGLVRSGDAPSWSHGDLVLRNLLLSGDRLGIIDLANTNPRGHLLNDVYGFEVALQSTVTSNRLRSDVRAALHRGLGPLDFPRAVHRFYWELHRRRWLYLLLRSHSPAILARGLWSLRRVRRPSDPRCLLEPLVEVGPELA